MRWPLVTRARYDADMRRAWTLYDHRVDALERELKQVRAEAEETTRSWHRSGPSPLPALLACMGRVSVAIEDHGPDSDELHAVAIELSALALRLLPPGSPYFSRALVTQP